MTHDVAVKESGVFFAGGEARGLDWGEKKFKKIKLGWFGDV